MPNGELAISLKDGESYSHLFASLLFFSLLALRLLCFFLVLGYFLVWPYCHYVLPWRCWPYCRYVVRRGFHIDVMPAPQLLSNTTRFPLPWDIGTPRHWNPESKHRDTGTSGHWNPKCTGRRKGTHPRTGNGHRPEELFSFFRYPLGSNWRSLRCAFQCRAAHGGYDVLGRCTLVEGTVFGLSFPETPKAGALL